MNMKNFGNKNGTIVFDPGCPRLNGGLFWPSARQLWNYHHVADVFFLFFFNLFWGWLWGSLLSIEVLMLIDAPDSKSDGLKLFTEIYLINIQLQSQVVMPTIVFFKQIETTQL